MNRRLGIGCLLLSLTAGTVAADVREPPAKPSRPPTRWVLRVQGMRESFLIPIAIMRAWKLSPGETVPVGMARDVAQDLGGIAYSPDILAKLERLDLEDRVTRIRAWRATRRARRGS